MSFRGIHKENDRKAGAVYEVIRCLDLATLTLFVLVCFGCALREPVSVTTLPPPEGERLLALVRERQGNFQSLNGLARVRGEVDEQSFSFTLGILASGPENLRLETLSPFGQPLMIVATNGELVEAMSPTRNRFWRGPVNADNLRAFLRLPMKPEDLVGTLLYRISIDPYDRLQAEYLSSKMFRVTLIGDDSRKQVLVFDGKSRLLGSARYLGTELQFSVEFSDFQEDTGFPETLGIKVPPAGYEVLVKYSDIQLNSEIQESRFRLEPFPGMRVQSFPQLGSDSFLSTGE